MANFSIPYPRPTKSSAYGASFIISSNGPFDASSDASLNGFIAFTKSVPIFAIELPNPPTDCAICAIDRAVNAPASEYIATDAIPSLSAIPAN